MKKFDFGPMNIAYMLEAKRLILSDRSMAKLILSNDDEYLDFVAGLTGEDMILIGQIHNPITSFRMGKKLLKELTKSVEAQDVSRLIKLDDRLSLAQNKYAI